MSARRAERHRFAACGCRSRSWAIPADDHTRLGRLRLQHGNRSALTGSWLPAPAPRAVKASTLSDAPASATVTSAARPQVARVHGHQAQHAGGFGLAFQRQRAAHANASVNRRWKCRVRNR